MEKLEGVLMDKQKGIIFVSGVIMFSAMIIGILSVYIFPDISMFLFFIGLVSFGIFGNSFLSGLKFNEDDYYFGIGLLVLIAISTISIVILQLLGKMEVNKDEWIFFPFLWFLVLMLAHPYIKGGKKARNP